MWAAVIFLRWLSGPFKVKEGSSKIRDRPERREQCETAPHRFPFDKKEIARSYGETKTDVMGKEEHSRLVALYSLRNSLSDATIIFT